MEVNLTLAQSTIRPLVMADAQDLATITNNRSVWMQLPNFLPQPFWMMDAMRFVAQVEAERPPMTYTIAIGDRCAGIIKAVRLRDIHKQTLALTFWLGEPYWGKGVASEAMSAFATYALSQERVSRLQAGVFSDNPAACRVLEKAGFSQEGILKNNILKAGKLLHEHVYARIQE